MYIILVLGNNYIRGDKMKNRRIKSFFVPVIYGTLVVMFLVSMFFAGKITNNLLFSKKDNNVKYVDGEIIDSQTSYATPLNFNCFNDENKEFAAKRLAELEEKQKRQ